MPSSKRKSLFKFTSNIILLFATISTGAIKNVYASTSLLSINSSINNLAVSNSVEYASSEQTLLLASEREITKRAARDYYFAHEDFRILLNEFQDRLEFGKKNDEVVPDTSSLKKIFFNGIYDVYYIDYILKFSVDFLSTWQNFEFTTNNHQKWNGIDKFRSNKLFNWEQHSPLQYIFTAFNEVYGKQLTPFIGGQGFYQHMLIAAVNAKDLPFIEHLNYQLGESFIHENNDIAYEIACTHLDGLVSKHLEDMTQDANLRSNMFNSNAMFNAAMKYNYRKLTVILEEGVNSNRQFKGISNGKELSATALRWLAIQRPHNEYAVNAYIETAKVLLKKGANPFKKDSDGHSAIEQACSKTHLMGKKALCELLKSDLAKSNTNKYKSNAI